MFLEHVLLPGNALYQLLQSSHAITEEPCAYLVAAPLLACVVANVYLDLMQLVRDLVRLT